MLRSAGKRDFMLRCIIVRASLVHGGRMGRMDVKEYTQKRQRTRGGNKLAWAERIWCFVTRRQSGSPPTTAELLTPETNEGSQGRRSIHFLIAHVGPPQLFRILALWSFYGGHATGAKTDHSGREFPQSQFFLNLARIPHLSPMEVEEAGFSSFHVPTVAST